MISAPDRETAVLLIDEAIASGATCKKACDRLGITERTFYRWKKRKTDTLIVKVVVSKNLYFLFVQVIRYCSVPDVSINK